MVIYFINNWFDKTESILSYHQNKIDISYNLYIQLNLLESIVYLHAHIYSLHSINFILRNYISFHELFRYKINQFKVNLNDYNLVSYCYDFLVLIVFILFHLHCSSAHVWHILIWMLCNNIRLSFNKGRVWHSKYL